MFSGWAVHRWLLIFPAVFHSCRSTHPQDAYNTAQVYAVDGQYTESTPEVVYHNEFAVHVPRGAKEAESIARKHGFVNIGQIGDLQNYFLFSAPRLRKRSVGGCAVHHGLLEQEEGVQWVQQQTELRRVKRSINYRELPDPLFGDQWFINNGAKDGSDMNVKPAWERGYTGAGVVVTILDDGIQHNHPDLARNYDKLASKDINDNDDDPMPQDNGDNKHGTRCAGEVAAVAFNNYCGVGIAFNASIGGVRMLDGLVNDAVEARSLSLNPSHIDIYSASWGPEDDGKTVDGPGPLAKQAFINGINSGRGGKGSIYVWASGNGGHHVDNCNCDGYTNSVFTLSISSATQGGLKPWYLEECSSTLATTYSSGTPGQDASITTVDQDARLRGDRMCTSSHTGTSASAPLAAGVCALALEANKDLTWRDMQHLVVLTSNPKPLTQETGWSKNSVGRMFSHKFGYGLLDAGALVDLAERWVQAPQQHICETRLQTANQKLDKATGMKVNFSMITDSCDNMISKVRFLEHVQCRLSVKYSPRGNLKISLSSPRGTKSQLLLPRPRDRTGSGFEDWPFLSVHFWGEDPTGEWTLEIENGGDSTASPDGIFKHWQLVLYGTEEDPNGRIKPKNGASPQTDMSESAVKGSTQSGPSEGQPTPIVTQNRNGEKVAVGNVICNNSSSSMTGEGCRCPTGQYLSLPRYSTSRLGVAPQPRTCRDCSTACRDCSTACKECFGEGSDQCLSCPDDFWFIQDISSCSSSCPPGYFANTTSRTCEACAECASCHLVNSKPTCLTCIEGLVLIDGVCRASCPLGSWNNQSLCTPCHPSCHSCTGSLDTQCGRCAVGTFYFERRCVSYCPPGYFSQDKLQECMPCPHGCDSCSGSDGSCSRCREDWIQTESGECLPPESRSCQPGMYWASGTCLACHISCNTCVGPKSVDCSSCYSDHKIHISSCVETCPPRSRSAYSKNSCLSCPHACAACSGDRCTQCLPGYFLHPDTGECITSCPGSFFPNQNVCTPCDPSCSDCYGPGSNHCAVCNISTGFLLAGGECLSSCHEGYFGTSGCTRCHRSCTTCTAQGPGNCTSCSPQQILVSGVCRGCEDGLYLNPVYKSCSPCHSSCSQCAGPDSNHCTSCSDPLQFDTWSSTCVPCCASSQDPEVPCCVCGDEGLCSSPSRMTRSLSGSSSVTSLLLFSACVVVLVFVFFLFQPSKLKSIIRRLERSTCCCVRKLDYRDTYTSDTPDNSPFLRKDQASSDVGSDEESDSCELLS